MLERTLRTYKAIAYRPSLAETTILLGQLNYLRGFLDTARQTLEEGRQLARSMHNDLLAGRALLSLGNIHQQLGQLGQARGSYNEAIEATTKIAPQAGALTIALAEIQLARTFILTGDLQEAANHLQAGHKTLEQNPLTQQLIGHYETVEGRLALAQGDFATAAEHFVRARRAAEAAQHPLIATEALQGIAETQLARSEFEASQETFLSAGRQFQLLEHTSGDGAVLLGLAQVNMGQSQWDAAQEQCDSALIRFQQTNDLINRADALLIRGLVHRSKDELDEALSDFEEALKLYHQQRRPLGVADTRFARGSINLLRNEPEQARDEQEKAIIQVERVMQTITDPQRWGLFLRQYAEQYAQTCITDVRLQHEAQARVLLQKFIQIAGKTEILHHLQEYEKTLITEGEELAESELRANTILLQRLQQVRKGLS